MSNMSDAPNPYEVTFLEEVEQSPLPQEIRFFHRKPTPNKITRNMIEDITWQAFLSKRWRFFGIGMLQLVLLIFCVLNVIETAVALMYSQILHGRFTWWNAVPNYLGIFILALVGYLLIAGMNLRLLRGEKIFHRPTWQRCFRLLVAMCNGICYTLICLLMFLPAIVLLITSQVAMNQIGDMTISNIWLAVFGLGVVLFCLFFLFVFGRYIVGLHYIVDRNVGCLTALRHTARFTRGNTLTIAWTSIIDFMLLYIIGAFTLGLGFLVMPGYLHCWLAVTYLLTTNQYERPTEPETSEW